ncbi:hypothetical protein A3H80_00020 [Candidatus Roizmanbacteria bacterium RIFCSPLOWO2_02_FULL_37_19]|uniref:HD domain-containing protein n=1 Tax=Candidatus Roizmanbacteria bacterium RIFCSPHIGHO2_02_FULL_37_24 TaxID=1802037 RepID=A0A1F7H0I5_9BACT|nr:MAG: hypothetical protein A2862_00750 [Candidatus Roizmanbacteria bacterium RIFCSPHIGHO2_01_FULL_38_41]OGK24759.1 MAG: hypothetical protein A3C24_01325 [Candidatus Roizmanbacteria bacterium RIFCSPHIGHO2_02_FULL_37_24]OGK31903.1 MAG: hypothetical protein A3E10_05660 [Candidatus Roizmanbacteria bacterium RIFCSPHIGHO2_12_FULL_37_23]OGK45059.1 MAG: hypothetical protein A2956_04515 [Candidatus Roizmanbacteria bacterium RIFCSPLOWO2_01_FULL_37_57]OGK53914.1 MAG: hypothetical protein A3H80_00020 [Ca
MILTRENALDILKKHLQNKNLINHCLCVEASMRGLARVLKNKNQKVEIHTEVWAMAGLLHDADWEATQSDPSKHTSKTIEWIKDTGENDQELIDCILTHNYEHNGFRAPESPMEWALFTCDELTGLIVAVALVRPEKKLSLVSVRSVLKKFPMSAFAAGVDREKIKLCEEKLGIPLEEFAEIVLKSMQQIAGEIGL